jgi:hypothetical protein
MVELFKICQYDTDLKNNTCLRSFENCPRVHVAKNGKTGRQFIQIGKQNFNKVLVRYGIKIEVFSGIDDEGKFTSGIRVKTDTTTGETKAREF